VDLSFFLGFVCCVLSETGMGKENKMIGKILDHNV
jgi:hypothetical protein